MPGLTPLWAESQRSPVTGRAAIRGCVLALALLACAGSAPAQASLPSDSALQEKYVLLSEPLKHNAFQKPLVLNSQETPKGLKGEIYAVLSHPFKLVQASLKQSDQWCEVMILHINTKSCQAQQTPTSNSLVVHIGSKSPQALEQASRVVFNFSVTAQSPQYFEILLDAAQGPMGTSDYRIRMEAANLQNGATFLHLTYSYSVNFAGRLAMQAYLATLGANKVGFTMVQRPGDSQPRFVDGVRGLVERNTMRYYLAINSLLESTKLQPAAQFEDRLERWYAAVEQYPRQLHEVDKSAYVEMKRAEYLRQNAPR
jgi:hypothetical protein